MGIIHQIVDRNVLVCKEIYMNSVDICFVLLFSRYLIRVYNYTVQSQNLSLSMVNRLNRLYNTHFSRLEGLIVADTQNFETRSM
jgi:hypothetical protein